MEIAAPVVTLTTVFAKPLRYLAAITYTPKDGQKPGFLSISTENLYRTSPGLAHPDPPRMHLSAWSALGIESGVTMTVKRRVDCLGLATLGCTVLLHVTAEIIKDANKVAI